MDIPELIVDAVRVAVPDSGIERLLLTAAIVFALTGLNLFVQRRILAGQSSAAHRRQWSAWSKNLLWIAGFVLVVGVWASQIAGFAFSVAALAAAILIVSKELLSCLLGTAYLALVRPFAVGDYVEIGVSRGQVLGMSPFSITLALASDANQITGKTVTVPASQALTGTVTNRSATGTFAMFLVRVSPPQGSDILSHEGMLLQAATEVCAAWQPQAEVAILNMERTEHMDLPSVAPKVLFDLSDPKQGCLVLRFTCEARLRVRAEQAILRRYLQLTQKIQEAVVPDKPED